MTKHAKIMDDVALQVINADPATALHPALAAEFEPVPDEVEGGWIRDGNGDWSAPASTPVRVLPAPVVTAMRFKLLWKAPERIYLKSLIGSDPAIADFFDLVDDPRADTFDLSLQSVQDGVDYCLGVLEAATLVDAADVPIRREQILTGQFQ